MSNPIATVFIVVLHDLMVRGDSIPKDTVLEVERAVRNDWIGSSLCRDATEQEIAQYQEDTGGSQDGTESAALLASAQAQLEALAKERDSLAAEVAELTKANEELTEANAQLGKDLTAAKKAAKAAE